MNHNTNTPSFNFNRTSVNPLILKPHPLLEELGFANKSDAVYAQMMKYFGHYESPVIDQDNNVITHWLDVQAAIDNAQQALDCYTVEMTIEQLRIFILLKHKYNIKNLIASFKTVQFYECYLENDADGIQLSKSLQGTTREKIAMLMHTSDSSIRRLKEVGEAKPEKLGLIEEGYTSFKQVRDEIKAERLAARTAARKAEQHVAPIQPNQTNQPEQYYNEPESNGGEISIGSTLPLPPSYYEEVPRPSGGPTHMPPTEPSVSEQYYPDETPIESTAGAPIDFTEGAFTIAGLGTLEISVTDNVPSVLINGEPIANMSYMPLLNRESETGTSQSFVLFQTGKKGMSIQLTIENFPKAA